MPRIPSLSPFPSIKSIKSIKPFLPSILGLTILRHPPPSSLTSPPLQSPSPKPTPAPNLHRRSCSAQDSLPECNSCIARTAEGHYATNRKLHKKISKLPTHILSPQSHIPNQPPHSVLSATTNTISPPLSANPNPCTFPCPAFTSTSDQPAYGS